MSDVAPQFSKGNKWIVDALNKVIAYARGHGVNPAGVPGWSWTVDGWQPPRVRAGETNSPRLWDVEVVSADDSSIKMSCPGVVRKIDDVDNTSLVSISGLASTFEVAAGDYLVLEWTAAAVCTLKVLSTWDGFPFPYVTTLDAEEFLIFDKTICPLWKVLATGDVATVYPGRHLPLGDAIILERLAPDAHLEIANYQAEHPTGKMIDVDRFWPGFGAA